MFVGFVIVKHLMFNQRKDKLCPQIKECIKINVSNNSYFMFKLKITKHPLAKEPPGQLL